jgi:hypothetical protein
MPDGNMGSGNRRRVNSSSLEKKIQRIIRRAGVLLGKRKREFVEDDVSRGNDAPGRQVKTAIAAMRARVPEKHTRAGAR